MRYADGTRFPWLGATAFQVPEMIAHGREADAVAFLDAMRDAGISLVRVLAMARFPGFVLAPREGRAAVARAVQLARDRDLYVEIVALADTVAYPDVPFDEQVREIGAIAARADTAVVELANEIQPVHPTQSPALGDKSLLVRLGGLVPAVVPFAFGSSHGGDPGFDLYNPTTGTRPNVYLTHHLERLPGDRGWRPWRQVRFCEELSARYRAYCVSDEPLRFGPTGDQDPAHVFAYGLMGRIFAVGTTFHFDSGRAAQAPTGIEREGLIAFIRGATYVPPGWEEGRVFQNANTTGAWPQSPVGPFDEADTVRVYTSMADNEALTVAIGVQRDPAIVWQNGFQPVEVVRNPFGYAGVWIIRAQR